MNILALLIVLTVTLLLVEAEAKASKKYVMPWLCLEICDSTAAIQDQLQTIYERRHLLSGVSFELYTLGGDCNIRKYTSADVAPNGLTQVASNVRAAGLDIWPMISSWPHPDSFITWMRKLFDDEACAETFITQAVAEAQMNGYTGFNVDFEPTYNNNTSPITSKDAQQYALFIDKFAKKLNSEGFKLSVDVATWITTPGGPSFWNYTSIAATEVNKGISMGTYTSNDQSFSHQLDLITNAFGNRAGVGLQNVNATDNSPLSDEEVGFRFAAIKAAGVHEIDIWSMPIPPNFWPFIESFVRDEE